MNKPRVMITGAAGFVGTYFWRQFSHKYDFVGIDKYGYASHKDERQGYSGGIAKLDCANQEDMQKAFTDASQPRPLAYFDSSKARPIDKLVIFHSETHNDNSFGTPVEFYRSNVLGFVNALEEARRHKIPKVYAVITDEVLRHFDPQFCDHDEASFSLSRVEESDATWTTKYNPTSPYSSSKACQEMIINAYRHSYNMDIVKIRPTNIYGPYQHPEKLISKAITNLLEGKKVPVYGAGAQYRDYTYISDTCDALDLIMSQEEPHLTYHIAANDERQNLDTVKEVLRALNRSEDMIEFIKDPRPVHDFSYSLDSSRIRDLGWAPKVSFQEGIQRTIEYFIQKYIDKTKS